MTENMSQSTMKQNRKNAMEPTAAKPLSSDAIGAHAMRLVNWMGRGVAQQEYSTSERATVDVGIIPYGVGFDVFVGCRCRK